jgi:hypothetical protein
MYNREKIINEKAFRLYKNIFEKKYHMSYQTALLLIIETKLKLIS